MIVDVVLDYDCQLEKYLKSRYHKMQNFKILKKSLDARGANRGIKPKFTYKIDVIFDSQKIESSVIIDEKNCSTTKIFDKKNDRPIIVGAGPSGLFCALKLLELGVKSILLERGERVNIRVKKIARYWKTGELDINSNVCFGEGGAGLFSDGKLMTRIKSPYVDYVLGKLVEFGAPEDIIYSSSPHIGSNKLRKVIIKIVDYLKANGVCVQFNAVVSDILTNDGEVKGVLLADGQEIYASRVVLASGHSARDVYQLLQRKNIAIEAKDFAVGVRIEHPREFIDELQLGSFKNDSLIGAARYRLAYTNNKTQRGVYSFCMCPGGFILSAGNEIDGMLVNGMSNYLHNSKWSNSAIVVTIDAKKDLFQANNQLAGIYFQREIEKRAFELSKKHSNGIKLPAQSVHSFLNDLSKSKKTICNNLPESSTISGVFNCKMDELFQDFICKHLREAIIQFDKKMKGFISDKAIIVGPETRTSSPVRVIREKTTLQSINCKNLYPCGEGAGYAGGITSAAVDGVRVACVIAE